MQGGGGGDAGRAPPSPRSNDSIASKISLLGQRVFGSEENQQHQHQTFQQQQNQQQHQTFQQQQNPSSMGFSLGEQAQERPFSQQHLQQKQESSQPIERGDFSLAPGFGPAQLFMNQNQPMLQPNVGAPVQAQAPGVSHGGGGAGAGVSQESLMGALSAIQQNISHLQSMLSSMNHGQQVPNALVQQQAAAAISQIARVAANMFPQSAQQPPPSHLPAPGPPRPPPQHLGQMMPPLITPSNFYQDCGPPGGGGNDPVMESNGSFSSAIRGMDGGAQGDTLAAQIGRQRPPPPTTGILPARSISPAQGGGVNAPSHLGNNMGPGGPRGGNHGSAAVPRESAKGGDLGRQHLSSRSATLDDHDEPTGGGGGESEGHRDEDDDGELEVLAPGSYDLVDMDAVEILAEHTHFCEICGKGFKRDANLRMHMRGHGDEYKTPAALARPDRGAGADSAAVRQRRFSCPYVGCKRNKKHRKFQPLKTMLCVKNHYRRSHCPKIHTCSKCKAKKFSVVADLKTHEKHCGCDKWQCSCGTSFSRKDKLFGHIGLFTGHTPAMPFADADGSGDLNVSDLGGGGDPTSLSGDVVGDAGYGTMASGLGGGNGMGLGTGGRQGQGLGSRGGGGLTVSKDGGLGPETSGSSDSFPSPGNLLPSYMSGNLFNTNYVQSGSGS